jgi:predicted O-methyltransferase YrrM
VSVPAEEPTNAEAVRAWIAEHAHDRFADVRRASEEHRAAHGPGCSVYPTASGPLLGVLAAAVGARRILELGCGLGYSALCLAAGAGRDATVETIEHDPTHAALAREHVAANEPNGRIAVLEGRGAEILPTLAAPYDLVFCDGDPDEFAVDLPQFERLLESGGLLVSANLFLGQYVPDLPSLPQAAEYRRSLLDATRWTTAFVPGGMAVSVKKP